MVASNNPINNTIGASISGVTNTLTVTNPSNTASSAARETIVVGGGSAADPTINWNVSGVTNWEMGIDNSVSDNLTISQSAALGTKDVWRMDTSGRRTMPLQPCFSVYLNTTVNNATGNGTDYPVLYDTIVFDQGSNVTLNSGGKTIFTAPITGKYRFSSSMNINNLSAAFGVCRFELTLTGISWRIGEINPGAVRELLSPDRMALNGGVEVTMTAGDTASILINITGSTKTIAIRGFEASTVLNFFTGFLVC